MEIRIDAQALSNALWNAALYTPKVGVVGGKALFSVTQKFSAQWMTFVSSDDFIFVEETVNLSSADESGDFCLSQADIKKLQSTIKEYSGELVLNQHDDKLFVTSEDISLEYVVSSPGEIWEGITGMLDEDYPAGTFSDLYINATRLKNLDRLRGADDNPIGLRAVQGDQGMLTFILGPSIRGLISSMNPVKLAERGAFTFEGCDAPSVEISSKVVLEDELPPWDEGDPHTAKDNTSDPDRLRGVKAKDRKYESSYSVQYQDAVDITIAPEHVSKEEFETYGY